MSYGQISDGQICERGMSATQEGDLQDHVLIVDDEFLIAMGLSMQVEDMGREVCATAATADDAVALAQKHRPAIVLMDVRLQGDKDGVDAALAIHRHVGSKVIFITGSREPATMARIHMDHPAAVLFKPISDRQLRLAIEEVARQ
jgi:two-component system, response regulator PdtaR